MQRDMQRELMMEGVVRGMIREELLVGMARRMGVVLVREWQVLRDLFGWDRETSKRYVEAYEFTDWILGTVGLVAGVAAAVVTGPAATIVGGVALVAKVGEIALKVVKVTEDEEGEFHWDPDWFGLASKLVGSQYYNPEKIGRVVGHVSRVGGKATQVVCEWARDFFEMKGKADKFLDRHKSLRDVVEGVEKYMMGKGNEGKYSQYLETAGSKLAGFYNKQIKELQTYLNHQIGGEDERKSQTQLPRKVQNRNYRLSPTGVAHVEQSDIFVAACQRVLDEKINLQKKMQGQKSDLINDPVQFDDFMSTLNRDIKILKNCISDPYSKNLWEFENLKNEVVEELERFKSGPKVVKKNKSKDREKCIKIARGILKRLRQSEESLKKLDEAFKEQGVDVGMDSVFKVTTQIQESDIAGAISFEVPEDDIYLVVENAAQLPKADPEKLKELDAVESVGKKSNEGAALFTIPELRGGYVDLAKLLNQKFAAQLGSKVEASFLRKLYQNRFLIAGDRIDLRDVVQALAGQRPDVKIYSAKKPHDNETNVFQKRPSVEEALAKIKDKK